MATEQANTASSSQESTFIFGSINIEPKLDGSSNFSPWKFVMKIALMGLDL